MVCEEREGWIHFQACVHTEILAPALFQSTAPAFVARISFRFRDFPTEPWFRFENKMPGNFRYYS